VHDTPQNHQTAAPTLAWFSSTMQR